MQCLFSSMNFNREALDRPICFDGRHNEISKEVMGGDAQTGAANKVRWAATANRFGIVDGIGEQAQVRY